MIERVVDIGGRAVHIAGDDADGYVDNLPDAIHETALDCATVLLADDAVILDVGANVGVLAIGFAHVAPRGRVIAVEPSPRAFPYLVRNLEAAGLPAVDTLQVAASDASGTLEFVDVDWFSAGSFVKSESIPSEIDILVANTKVPAEPLDSIVERLGLDRVDFVKLDVEGHELQAIRGAASTFRRFRPTAVIESNLFTATCFGNTLPFDFLGNIRAVFPYVYDFDRSLGLLPIADEHAVYSAVQRQFLAGRPSDLICRFEPLSDDAQRELARLTSPTALDAAHEKIEQLTGLLESTHQALSGARHQLETTGEELAATQQALDAALADNRSLRDSTSWKLTAPVRRIGTWLGRGSR